MDNTQEQLDPSIMALTKAIGHQESGGKYDLMGDNGHSSGAYQWNNPTPLQKGEVPANFKGFAKDVGADENDFSPENQDRVAYKTVEAWGKQGLTPAQIASKWNSGQPDTYKTAKPGYNAAQGVKYDVKSYVDNVAKYYDQYNQPTTQQQVSNGFNPNPYSNPQNKSVAPGQFDLTGETTKNETAKPSDETLGGQLTNRAAEATQGLNSIVGGKATGSSRVSGLIQTAGAVAGGLGDIVNKGLELIPGVKQVEDLIGQGVGSLAKTDTGQAVIKSISDFSNAHPELSKDIGAGFNIVTAIPILKGLGVVGKIGMEAGSQALKGIAEKSFIPSATEMIGSTKAGVRLLETKPTVIQDMLDRRLVGDIKGGEYVTKDAITKSERTGLDLNDQVKTILDKPQYANISQDGEQIAKAALDNNFPGSRLTPTELIENAKKLTGTKDLQWEKFEAGQTNLQEINELRSALDRKVKKVFLGPISIDSPDVALSKELGAALSNSMRSVVQTTAPETQALFKEMTTQFDIQRALGLMNGKSVQPGGVAKFAGHVAGIGTGGTIGGLVGGPTGAVIGGMAGDKAAGTVATKLAKQNMVQGVLKRTGKNAIKTSKKELVTKLPGLFGGAVNVK